MQPITPALVQEVVRKTTQEKPDNATHWSTRTMAAAVGMSHQSVHAIWKKNDLKPHLVRVRDNMDRALAMEEQMQQDLARVMARVTTGLPDLFHGQAAAE